MIADAYKYAAGIGGMPREIELANLVDRFGSQAIYGRVMGAKEVRAIKASEAVIRSYQSREASGNWASWVVEHEAEAQLLATAEGLVNNGK